MNKVLIALALIADAALVVNVVHHWSPVEPKTTFQINCQTDKGLTVCLAHNDVKE